MIGLEKEGENNVLEMWQEPDVIRTRLFAWGAGAEDKPTVIDYACPLLHMLPILRSRFATHLAPPGAGVNKWLAQEIDGNDANSPPRSPRSPRSPRLAGDEKASSLDSSGEVTNSAVLSRRSSSSSSRVGSPSFLHTLRGSSKRKQELLPEVTLRLVENGSNARTYWLSTARSLREQGCTPSNSANSGKF